MKQTGASMIEVLVACFLLALAGKTLLLCALNTQRRLTDLSIRQQVLASLNQLPLLNPGFKLKQKRSMPHAAKFTLRQNTISILWRFAPDHKHPQRKIQFKVIR